MPSAAAFPDRVGKGTVMRTLLIVAVATAAASSPLPLPSALDGSVRLVGGSSAAEGRMEVYHEGAWGAVCDTRWTATEAAVVCGQLGLPVQAAAPASFGPAPPGTPIWLDLVDCSRKNNSNLFRSLSLCQSLGWGNYTCSHANAAGVRCVAFSPPPPPPRPRYSRPPRPPRAPLPPGPQDPLPPECVGFAGKVQRLAEALRAAAAAAQRPSDPDLTEHPPLAVPEQSSPPSFPSSDDERWADGPSDDETDAQPEWLDNPEAQRTALPHGSLHLVNGPTGRKGVVQLAWCGYLGTLSMRGTQHLVRTSYADVAPGGRAGGSCPSSGGGGVGGGGLGGGAVVRASSWQDSNRTVNALRAAAVCQRLGYLYGRHARGSQRSGTGTGLVFDVAPVCMEGAYEYAHSINGDPTEYPAGLPGPAYPGACPGFHVVLSASPHTYDLTVECYNRQEDLQPPPYVPKEGDPPPGALRLMSYSSASGAWSPTDAGSGFVQVFLDGQWGAVCAVGWGDADAGVACRQLGYAGGRADPGTIFPGTEIRYRWRVVHLSNVSCGAGGGEEAALLDCPAVSGPDVYCHYSDLAAVACASAPAPDDGADPPPWGNWQQPPYSDAHAPPANEVVGSSPPPLVDVGQGRSGPPDVGVLAPSVYPGRACTFCVSVFGLVSYVSRRGSMPALPRNACNRFAAMVPALLSLPEVRHAAAELGMPPWVISRPFRCRSDTISAASVDDPTQSVTSLTACGAMWNGASLSRALASLTDGASGLQYAWSELLADRMGLLYGPERFDVDYDYEGLGSPWPLGFKVTSPTCRLAGEPIIWYPFQASNYYVRNVQVSPPPAALLPVADWGGSAPPGGDSDPSSGAIPGPEGTPSPAPAPAPAPAPVPAANPSPAYPAGGPGPALGPRPSPAYGAYHYSTPSGAYTSPAQPTPGYVSPGQTSSPPHTDHMRLVSCQDASRTPAVRVALLVETWAVSPSTPLLSMAACARRAMDWMVAAAAAAASANPQGTAPAITQLGFTGLRDTDGFGLPTLTTTCYGLVPVPHTADPASYSLPASACSSALVACAPPPGAPPGAPLPACGGAGGEVMAVYALDEVLAAGG